MSKIILCMHEMMVKTILFDKQDAVIVLFLIDFN